jgi:predicted transcriptional regulator
MDNEQSDLEKLDKVFPHLHESGKFNLVTCIPADIVFVSSSGLSYVVEDEISNLLTKNGYAIINKDNYPDYIAELTDKGREAKKSGGHFAYLKKVADKEHHEKESSKYDLLQKKFIYKARYTPYIFSTLALIGTVISLIIAYKALHKSAPH